MTAINDTDKTPRITNWDTFFKGLKVDMTQSIVHRGAYVLDWAADKHPGSIIPYNIHLKFVMGYGHTPRMNNDEVERFRRKIPATRPILQMKYKRDLRNVSGVGARATVDSLDQVKSSITVGVRRVNSAHQALARAAALVDVNELPASGPDKLWRDWYTRTVTPGLKVIASDERLTKLLLPPAKAEDESSGKKDK